MTEPLGSGSGEAGSGAKENFIGRIEFSRVDCDCESCQKGRESAESQGYDIDNDIDHLAHIEPLTQYDNPQNILGVDVRKSWGSKWMLWIGHFENIHGPLSDNGITSLEGLTDFLEGRVYEWRDITFEENEEFTWQHGPDGPVTYTIKDLFSGMTNTPNAMLMPVREVTDDEELADLGAKESIEVEEAEF